MRMDESLDNLKLRDLRFLSGALTLIMFHRSRGAEFMELFDEILHGIRQKDQMREENTS